MKQVFIYLVKQVVIDKCLSIRYLYQSTSFSAGPFYSSSLGHFFLPDGQTRQSEKTHLSQILVLISSKDLGTQGTCTCIYPA